MTKEQIESHITRILSGEFVIKGESSEYLIVKNPTLRVRMIADSTWKNIEKTGMTDEELMTFLKDNKIWSDAHDRDVKTLQDLIQDTKISLWYAEEVDRAGIRKKLKECQEKLMEYLGKLHSHDFLLQSYIDTASKQRCCIADSIYDISDNKISIDSLDKYENIDRILGNLISEKCQDQELRKIALSDHWKLLWDASKVNGRGIFNGCGAELSDEQVSMISWSQFFENVREHQEFPGEKVLEESDLFDGWCFVQRKKNQGEQDARDINSRLTEKVATSDEVFVVKRSPLNWSKKDENDIWDDNEKDFVKKVDKFNDPMARGAKIARSQALREHGELQHNELPDIRKEIEMQFARGEMHG